MTITPGGRIGSDAPLGPGDLWHTPGLKLPRYIRIVVHGLLKTGQAHDTSSAVSMAVAAMKRWAAGGDHVRPQVQAAAAAALAEWESDKVRAHADHSRNIDLNWAEYDAKRAAARVAHFRETMKPSPHSHVGLTVGPERAPRIRVANEGRIHHYKINQDNTYTAVNSSDRFSAAQQEMARRIAASKVKRNGTEGRHPTNRMRHTGPLPAEGRSRFPLGAVFTGGLKSQFSAEDAQQLIDLGWDELLHPRGHGGRFIRKDQQASDAKQAASRMSPERRAANANIMRYASLKSSDSPQLNVNELARHHANQILASVRDAEPQVTSDLREAVGSLGGHMDGLKESAADPEDFRFKTAGSMQRKLVLKGNEEHRLKGAPSIQEGIRRYSGRVADALRYTAVFNRDSMVADTHKMIGYLEERGYHVTGIENTFGHGQPYSGVNMNVTTPKGVTFELQVHTPESIHAKMQLNHKDYEVVRDANASHADKVAAYNRMVAVNRMLARPANFEQLGEQLHRTTPELHNEELIREHQAKLQASEHAAKLGGVY